jgi:hypothetical protein
VREKESPRDRNIAHQYSVGIILSATNTSVEAFDRSSVDTMYIPQFEIPHYTNDGLSLRCAFDMAD